MSQFLSLTNFFKIKIPVWIVLPVFIFFLFLTFFFSNTLNIAINSNNQNANKIALAGNSNSFFGDESFALLNPLHSKDNPNIEIEPFKNNIVKIVNQLKGSNPNIKDISVIFFDFNSDYFFTINDQIKYYPASMLKVPLLMYYLKKSETNPSLLEQKYTLKRDERYFRVPNNLPVEKMLDGKDYSVRELLERVVKYSDNDASFLLEYSLKEKELEKFLAKLEIHYPDMSETGGETTTIEESFHVFRMLFNSTFLNKQSSQYALNLLTESFFEDGLKAGLPKGTKIAHKFGLWQSNNTQQMHEFAIVYNKGNPYALGIMTRGNGYNNLLVATSTISREVFAQTKDKVQLP